MGKYRILIVDDTPAIHQDFETILGKSEHDTARSKNEEEMDDLASDLFGGEEESEEEIDEGEVEFEVSEVRQPAEEIYYEIDHAYQGDDRRGAARSGDISLRR